ncbi:MAG: TonB-dependent receptor [Saprospiraceae bacterium]|nr:TonB-dependent receptor [Saprospiraceae bacterium]
MILLLKRIITIISVLLLSLSLHAQQRDTLLLNPKELAEKDLYTPLQNPDKNIKIISGSRFPVAAADLPFSTHVITREEIRRNGYETLVDALKMVPGIRVSQPGSATEGETFLMRGLLGNTYAKILINDVPVKPTYLASMPIGAQLPIKEAERIEIIYGAGTAIYGSDGAAGVINIITRESDKPVFMQADLAVGGGVYSSVNVMFGGRLGRDERILKYFAYGSNVLFEDRNIWYDRGYNYLPSTYTAGEGYKKFPNFGDSTSNALITNTPHLSRKFGFNVKYKRLTLSAETMYRRDHSSLGYNPVAYSYANPQTYTGEAVLRFNLNIFKEKEKSNRKTDITFLRLNMDSRSSSLPIQNRLSLMLLEAAKAQARQDGSSDFMPYFEVLRSKHLDGLRYFFSEANEYRVEHVRNYRLFKAATLTLGANIKAITGFPVTPLLNSPVTDSSSTQFASSIETFNGKRHYSLGILGDDQTELNGYGQLFYNGKKLKLSSGANYVFTGTFGGEQKRITPRVSGLWEFQEGINLRTSWGRTFRYATSFYNSNSYSIFSNGQNVLYRSDLSLNPEITTSWESGIRWKSENGGVNAEVLWFLNKTDNLIRYGKSEEWRGPDSTDYFGQLGYSNLVNTPIRFTGGQASLFFENEINGRKSNGLLSYSWLNYKESDLAALDADGVTAPPKGRIWQFRNNFNPFKHSVAILDIIRYKEIATTGGSKPKTKLWTFDVTWRYAFSDRFDAYLKIINLFNKKYSGILPEGDPNDLLRYNPQTGFFLRLGMNYNIE